jgi:MFS family permease
VAPAAGRLTDRAGAALPIVAGLAVEAAGLAIIGTAAPTTPLVVVAVALFAAGAGLGLFQVPYMAMVMAAFPAAQQGAAGGYAFLARTLGTVGGVLVLASVFATRRQLAGPEAAFADAFLLAALAVAVAAALACVPIARRSP